MELRWGKGFEGTSNISYLANFEENPLSKKSCEISHVKLMSFGRQPLKRKLLGYEAEFESRINLIFFFFFRRHARGFESSVNLIRKN